MAHKFNLVKISCFSLFLPSAPWTRKNHVSNWSDFLTTKMWYNSRFPPKKIYYGKCHKKNNNRSKCFVSFVFSLIRLLLIFFSVQLPIRCPVNHLRSIHTQWMCIELKCFLSKFGIRLPLIHSRCCYCCCWAIFSWISCFSYLHMIIWWWLWNMFE